MKVPMKFVMTIKENATRLIFPFLLGSIDAVPADNMINQYKINKKGI